MRLRLAANNQATRRNEIIKSYLQLGSSSNRYAPRLPQQETKSSTKQLAPTDPILGPENLLKTGFAQRTSLVALPVAISHKASLKPTRCPSATLIQKKSTNEPKLWSHFWDRMHNLVKEKRKDFHGLIGLSGGTKNETAKSQNQQQRPTRATKKNYNCVYLSNKHINLEQRRPAHTKPDFN